MEGLDITQGIEIIRGTILDIVIQVIDILKTRIIGITSIGQTYQ